MKTLSKFLPTDEMQSEFDQYKELKTDSERAKFQENRAKRLEKLSDDELALYVNASGAGLQATVIAAEEFIMAHKLGNIANALSLSYISKTYFGRSRSWLYQRLNGHKVNGKQAQFTPDEKKQFASALKDLSAQLQETSRKFA